MRTLTTTAVVSDNHTLTAQVPADIAPGTKQVVIVLEDAVPVKVKNDAFWLTPHPVGPTDPTCTYRREDLYGDDGR